MFSLLHESQSNVSFFLFGLLIKCPFGRELGSCPLLSMRAVECLEDKYVLAEQLSEAEAHQLLAVHQACYRARLKANLHRARGGLARQTNLPHRGAGVKQGGSKQFSSKLIAQPSV